jgi:hypothetical protein
MYMIWLVGLSVGSIANASLWEDPLRCQSELTLVLKKANKQTSLEPGGHLIDVDDASVIEVKDGKTVVAKIFPQDGLHSISKSKDVKIDTDEKTYLKIEYTKSGKKLAATCGF